MDPILGHQTPNARQRRCSPVRVVCTRGDVLREYLRPWGYSDGKYSPMGTFRGTYAPVGTYPRDVCTGWEYFPGNVHLWVRPPLVWADTLVI